VPVAGGAATYFAIVSTSSAGSTGFDRNSLQPASRQRWRSAPIACAVSATMTPVVPHAAQARGRVVAVEARHLHVHQDDVVREARRDGVHRELARGDAVARDLHVGARFAQMKREQLLVVDRVLDEQDARARRQPAGRREGAGCRTTSAGCAMIATPSSGPVGRRSVNVLPASAALSTAMSPPSMCARRCEIARPSPVPPEVRVGRRVALRERLEQRGWAASEIPQPVSATTMWISPVPSACGTSSAGDRHAARVRELHGVADEVQQDLPKPRRDRPRPAPGSATGTDRQIEALSRSRASA
jgi:hypothetical protein